MVDGGPNRATHRVALGSVGPSLPLEQSRAVVREKTDHQDRAKINEDIHSPLAPPSLGTPTRPAGGRRMDKVGVVVVVVGVKVVVEVMEVVVMVVVVVVVLNVVIEEEVVGGGGG